MFAFSRTLYLLIIPEIRLSTIFVHGIDNKNLGKPLWPSANEDGQPSRKPNGSGGFLRFGRGMICVSGLPMPPSYPAVLSVRKLSTAWSNRACEREFQKRSRRNW